MELKSVGADFSLSQPLLFFWKEKYPFSQQRVSRKKESQFGRGCATPASAGCGAGEC
jgi:hypothetical protein